MTTAKTLLQIAADTGITPAELRAGITAARRAEMLQILGGELALYSDNSTQKTGLADKQAG